MTYDTVATVSQVTSLIMFLVMFLVVIGYVLWPKNLEKFDTAARTALDLDKGKTSTRGKK
jgi:cbb3-type cytochrome oxidase subunit 3